MSTAYIVACGDDDPFPEYDVVAVFLDREVAVETVDRLGGDAARVFLIERPLREEAFGRWQRIHTVNFDRYTPNGVHYVRVESTAFRDDDRLRSLPHLSWQAPTRDQAHNGRWIWHVYAEALDEDEAWSLARAKRAELIGVHGDIIPALREPSPGSPTRSPSDS